MTVGPIRERLEGLQRRGQYVPLLAKEPILYPDLLPFWTAFSRLHGTRSIGQAGPSGLLLSEVLAWLDLNVVSATETRKEYVHFVLFMDQVYLEWVGKQTAQRLKNGKSERNSGRRS